MADIEKTAIRVPFRNGHTIIGTERVQITLLDDARRGIFLKSHNAGGPPQSTIFIGTKIVTNLAGNSPGVPLLSGETLFIEITDPTQLWAISDQPDQNLFWFVM